MKQFDFTMWFSQQYGGTPNPKDLQSLRDEEGEIESRLCIVRQKICRQMGLQVAWTAALYARQVFCERPARRRTR